MKRRKSIPKTVKVGKNELANDIVRLGLSMGLFYPPIEATVK
jgi:hypothetical protein